MEFDGAGFRWRVGARMGLAGGIPFGEWGGGEVVGNQGRTASEQHPENPTAKTRETPSGAGLEMVRWDARRKGLGTLFWGRPFQRLAGRMPLEVAARRRLRWPDSWRGGGRRCDCGAERYRETATERARGRGRGPGTSPQDEVGAVRPVGALLRGRGGGRRPGAAGMECGVGGNLFEVDKGKPFPNAPGLDFPPVRPT